MPRNGPGRAGHSGNDGPPGATSGSAAAGLLRHGHVFSAAIRESLELHPLRCATDLPLSALQVRILRLIARGEGRRPGELAKLFGLTAAGVTKNIERLAHLGLVVRRRSSHDSRVRFVIPSAEARRLLVSLDAAAAERIGAALEQFTAADVDEFLDVLGRLSSALLAGPAAVGGPCLRCAGHVGTDCHIAALVGGCPCTRPHRSRRRTVSSHREVE